MLYRSVCVALCVAVFSSAAFGQLGKRFPSEKKVVVDPVTGVPLTFLTTGPSGDAKLYQTHQPWTADGKWVIFRSGNRVEGSAGQAFAVNEESGVIVQLTEGPVGATSALNVAQKSMKLYYTRSTGGGGGGGGGAGRGGRGRGGGAATAPAGAQASTPAAAEAGRGGAGAGGGGVQVTLYELDLEKLFKDSEANTVKEAGAYERVVGKLPAGMRESGGFGLDANEEVAYIGVGGGEVGEKVAPGFRVAPLPEGARMGSNPGGLRSINIRTGEVKHIIDVPFQMGHVQTNPFNPGEIIYCWETGGKAPQRTWTVMADGSGNRPLYREADYEWVTHEAVITKDEVAIAIMGHVNTAREGPYGEAGTRLHPTGLAVVNLRNRQVRIEAQTASGSGLWHVNGSYDGRFLVGDDFSRRIYLIDRKTSEMITLSAGHKASAADHPHPIFSPDGRKILIQSAMIAADDRSLDICVVPVPQAWLERKYTERVWP